MGIKLKWFRANLSLEKNEDAVDTPRLAVYRPYGGEEFFPSYKQNNEFQVPAAAAHIERKPVATTSLSSLKESRSHKGQVSSANTENIVIKINIEESSPEVLNNNINEPLNISSKNTEEKVKINNSNSDKDQKKQKQNEEKLIKEQEKKAKKEREERMKREKEQLKKEKEEQLRKAKEDKIIKEQQKKYMKEKEKHAKKMGKAKKEGKSKKKSDEKLKKDKVEAVASVTIDQEAVGSVQENLAKPSPRVANPLAVPGNTYKPNEAFANWDMVAAHRQNIKRDIKPNVPKSDAVEPPSFLFMSSENGSNQKQQFGRKSEASNSSDEFNA